MGKSVYLHCGYGVGISPAMAYGFIGQVIEDFECRPSNNIEVELKEGENYEVSGFVSI